MDTINILEKIINSVGNINGIFFHEYDFAQPLEFRIDLNRDIKHQISTAKINNRKNQLGFFDNLMHTFYENDNYSEKILLNLLQHHSSRNLFEIKIKSDFAYELANLRSSNKNIAINSKVSTLTDTEYSNLLLLDFKIPNNNTNQKIVESVLKSIEVGSGFLLNSGKSYHFMGKKLVSKNFLKNILYKSLFYTPIIDKYWIAHQLIDDSCSLRVTAKDGVFPTLIKEF